MAGEILAAGASGGGGDRPVPSQPPARRGCACRLTRGEAAPEGPPCPWPLHSGLADPFLCYWLVCFLQHSPSAHFSFSHLGTLNRGNHRMPLGVCDHSLCRAQLTARFNTYDAWEDVTIATAWVTLRST